MGQPQTARLAPQHRRPVPAAGADGNEKLTAMTGALLLVGFAVEGFTIASIHRLLFLHFLVGLLLIGPVLLKIGSTMYRFVRYYTGSAPYVRKGPPSPVLRVLGPLVVLTSVAVLGTGVMLAGAGRSRAVAAPCSVAGGRRRRGRGDHARVQLLGVQLLTEYRSSPQVSSPR